MIEGWHNDDYLVLFDDRLEALRMSDLYGISMYLPGYTFLGLRGWDDFIVADVNSNFFTIPTVPLDPKELAPFGFHVDLEAITPDERFTHKVKWYVTPIIFGGDPNDCGNLTWITLEQHAGLVQWWCKLYRDTITPYA